MADINITIVSGFLTEDPELRYTKKEQAVCSFRMAINRTYNVKDSEVEETCFMPVTIWGKKAESFAEGGKKGSKVFVNGYLNLNQWENDEGPQMKIEIIAKEITLLK